MKQKTKFWIGIPIALLLCLMMFLAMAACTDPTDDPDDDDDDDKPTETLTWSGLDDLSVIMGDVTDPMTGITVTDNVLGKDVTDQVVVLNSEDHEEELTNLGVWDEFEDFNYNMAGSYTVYYMITSSGVTETKSREIVVVAAHNLGNGDFTQTLSSGGYYKWTFDAPGGSASVSQDSSTGKPLITITNVGNGWWSLQYINSVNLTAGETYKISITAKSDTGKSVAFGFEDINNDYAMLQRLTVHRLTSDMTTYVSYYTADANYQNAKAVLYLGYMLDSDLDADEHTVLLDRINIEVVESCSEVSFSGLTTLTIEDMDASESLDLMEGVSATYGEQDLTDRIQIIGEVPTKVLETTIYAVVYYIENENGPIAYAIRNVRFEVFKENEYDVSNGDFSEGYSYWTQDVNANNPGEAEFNLGDDGAEITIVTPSSDGWHIQLHQYVTFTANTNYVITIRAKASIARSIVFELAGSIQYTMNLTTEFQDFEFYYTAKSSGSCKVAFLMGGGGSSNAGSVIYLNDISISLDADQTQYEAYELVNSKFVNGLRNWSTEGETASFVGGEGYVAVTVNSDSDAGWRVQLRQDGLAFEAGVTYVITVTAKVEGVESRTVTIEVPVLGIAEVITLTNEAQTFTITFTPGEDVSGARVGALLGGTGVAGSTTTFYEFSITVQSQAETASFSFGGENTAALLTGKALVPEKPKAL